MRTRTVVLKLVLPSAACALALWLAIPGRVARAHCDTLDGPVAKEAMQALEGGDVSPVLKWVRKDDEAEIREAFAKARAVRAKGDEAKALADRFFLETLIRIHRAAEGAPFTGLKSAGADVPEVVRDADKALDAGSVDALTDRVAKDVSESIKKRFQKAMEAKKGAGKSVEAGRAYVAAYVDFVHTVEAIHGAAAGGGHHAEAEGKGEAHAGHGAEGKAAPAHEHHTSEQERKEAP